MCLRLEHKHFQFLISNQIDIDKTVCLCCLHLSVVFERKMSQGSWGALPKGAGGFSSLYKDSRKKVTASSENYRCQKCLEVGHFTYECQGERKYVAKTSRTVMLKRRIEGDTKGVAKHGKQKKVEESSSSDSSSDSDSSSSDSSDSSSSDDNSEEEKKRKERKKKSSKKKKKKSK